MLIVNLAEAVGIRQLAPTLQLGWEGGGGESICCKVLVKLFRQQYWQQGRQYHFNDDFLVHQSVAKLKKKRKKRKK